MLKRLGLNIESSAPFFWTFKSCFSLVFAILRKILARGRRIFFFCKFWLELLFSGRSVKKVVAGDKQVSYANTPRIKVIAILEFS